MWSRSRPPAVAASLGRVELVADGRVEGIFLTETHGELPQSVERVRAVPGSGLVGNRYFFADGDAPPGCAITLIAAEGIEAFEQETGIPFTAAESRRNVLTRGVDVNGLVGRHFFVGEVECVGVELCEPCAHLQGMTKPGILKGMVHRAGLNADVLREGEIAVGDAVTVEA
jgi:MOSC domain-containing protein YiiM